jgi:hypothetical protein
MGIQVKESRDEPSADVRLARTHPHTHQGLLCGEKHTEGRKGGKGATNNNGDISDENGTDGLSFPHLALPSPQEEDERRHQAGIAALGA